MIYKLPCLIRYLHGLYCNSCDVLIENPNVYWKNLWRGLIDLLVFQQLGINKRFTMLLSSIFGSCSQSSMFVDTC